MKTLLVSLLIAFNLSGNTAKTNDCMCKDNYLYQHWVMSDKESKDGVIVYRPYHMADEKKVAMHHKYSGMEIKKGGKVFQYRWIKCGNDTGPEGYSYQWELKGQKDGSLLLNIKNKQAYEVLTLTKNMLKVKAIKS